MPGSLWRVVSPALNCRRQPNASSPVMRQYKAGDILQVEVYRGGSDEVHLNAKDATGKPWMRVRATSFKLDDGGQHKSYCILVDRSTGGETQRLQVMEQSQDGFYIAEADLIFRGPGELLGTKQSGLPEFALANLATDHEILGQARYAAEKVIQYPIKPAVAAEIQHRCATSQTDKILN
ncbi:MAG: hypothetical protein NW224_19015 [Leptolyngbyaceae cyanobacterium bins.302]|nr:hypothetical protein [Leptolyngbyaceae cyanobacterium bins.302]